MNPELVKHVTCFIDGHDSRINCVNTDIHYYPDDGPAYEIEDIPEELIYK